MNKPWKVVLAFIAVFAAGVIAGGPIAVRMAPTFVQRRVFSEQFSTTVMRVLTESLALSPEQQAKIRPIVAAAGDDLLRLRRETSETMNRMNAGIQKELNSEQRTKHQEFLDRMKEREQRDRERAKRRSESGSAEKADKPPVDIPAKP